MVFFERFFFEPASYNKSITRQNERYAKQIEIIDMVESGRSVDEISNDFLLRYQTTIVESIAKQHGILNFNLGKDHSAAIARFASENNALAVLGDYFDHLIYPGNWKLWSIKSINIDSLTTNELNRHGLRSTLGLTDEQLVVLPTLAGNDIIRFEEIEEAIGANFRFTPGAKFPNIARYIKNELPAEIYQRARAIAWKMFGNTREATLKRVKDSLNSYTAVSFYYCKLLGC